MLSIIITIAIALSMDTFSLALTIGTLGISNKFIIYYSLLVGICHFFFPLFGSLLESKVSSYIFISANKLLGIIFLFLFLKLIRDLTKKDQPSLKLNILNQTLLAISVSLDSFTTGIGLKAITTNYYLSSTVFFIISSIFTLIGLKIGKESTNHLGIVANYLGLILLLFLSIIHLCK